MIPLKSATLQPINSEYLSTDADVFDGNGTVSNPLALYNFADDKQYAIKNGKFEEVGGLPTISETNTLVGGYYSPVSNPSITIDKQGSYINQITAITIVDEQTPSNLTDNDAYVSASYNNSTAWYALKGTTANLQWTTSTTAGDWWQYLWDDEQESNLIMLSGVFPATGKVELRVDGSWVNIYDITSDSITRYVTTNALPIDISPFEISGDFIYLFLPQHIKHTGIKITCTTYTSVGTAKLRGVLVANATFTWSPALRTRITEGRAKDLQFYDAEKASFEPMAQPFFDRWRYYADSVSNIFYTSIVAGTHYRLFTAGTYLEAPNWTFTNINYQFAVHNYTTGICNFRLRTSSYYALYKGKVYQGTQNIPIPPYSTFTCTLVSTRYYLIECSSPDSIQFPSTAVASTNANELDWYGELDANVAFTCGTSGTITVGATNKVLSSVKVGQNVSISGYIDISAVSSPVGTLTLTGLPHTCKSGVKYDSELSISVEGVTIPADHYWSAYVINNTTTVRIRLLDLTGAVVDASPYITTSAIIRLGGRYNASS